MNQAAQLLKALMDHVKGFCGKNLFKPAFFIIDYR